MSLFDGYIFFYDVLVDRVFGLLLQEVAEMAGKSHRNRNRGKLEKKGVDVENSVAAEGVAGETVPSSDSAEDSAGKVNGESVVKHEGENSSLF